MPTPTVDRFGRGLACGFGGTFAGLLLGVYAARVAHIGDAPALTVAVLGMLVPLGWLAWQRRWRQLGGAVVGMVLALGVVVSAIALLLANMHLSGF